jgi:S1-C subfamily serine protease
MRDILIRLRMRPRPVMAVLSFCIVSALCAQTPTKADENPSVRDRLTKLETKIDQPRPKDSWDKVSSISGLVSGVLAALIAALAAYLWNERQRRSESANHARDIAIQQAQTVEAFMPYLTSGSQASITAALMAIESLGNPELTAKLATLFGGSGGLEAMLRIAEKEGVASNQTAINAIGDILHVYRSSIVQLETKADLPNGTGFFIDANATVVTSADVMSRIAMQTSERTVFQGVWAVTFDGRRYKAKVLALDRKRNLALLRLDGLSSSTPLPIEDVDDIKPLSQVAAIAHSKTLRWMTIVGTSTGSPRLPAAGAITLAINMQSQPGFSGAPVFDALGKVVGLISSGSQDSDLTFVTPGRTIIAFVAGSDPINSDLTTRIDHWSN